jgi:hypothetical protein
MVHICIKLTGACYGKLHKQGGMRKSTWQVGVDVELHKRSVCLFIPLWSQIWSFYPITNTTAILLWFIYLYIYIYIYIYSNLLYFI